VRAEALRSAEPTHAHPDGAAGAAAVAIAAALAATSHPPAAILREVVRFTPPGQTVERLRRAADTDVTADPLRVGLALGTGLDVAAHDTVPFALWVAVRHLSSYEDAVWTAAAQYGDCDTLGAIVGGIVVLATGEAAIPAAWRAAVEPLP
jgi:ADP-ribosylglycohydrolase